MKAKYSFEKSENDYPVTWCRSAENLSRKSPEEKDETKYYDPGIYKVLLSEI